MKNPFENFSTKVGDVGKFVTILTMLAAGISEGQSNPKEDFESQKKKALELIKEISNDLKKLKGSFRNIVATDSSNCMIDFKDNGQIVVSQLMKEASTGPPSMGKITYILDGGKDKDGKTRIADGAPDDFGLKLTNWGYVGREEPENENKGFAEELENNEDIDWMTKGDEKLRAFIGGSKEDIINYTHDGRKGIGAESPAITLDDAKEGVLGAAGIYENDLSNLMNVYVRRLTIIRDAINKKRIEASEKALKAQIEKEEQKQHGLNKFRQNLK